MNTQPKGMKAYHIINADRIETIDNMAAMAKGLNCRYLECTLSHHEPPRYIAYQWKRKLPNELNRGHVIVDFDNGR